MNGAGFRCLKSHPFDAKHHAPYPSASTILHRPHRNHYYLRTIFKSTYECWTLTVWRWCKGTMEWQGTVALLDHLIKNRTFRQGNGNFKDPVFTSAAEAVSSIPIGERRGPVSKTSKVCKNKWTAVSVIISYHDRPAIHWLLIYSWKGSIQLLKIFIPTSLVRIGIQLQVRLLRGQWLRRSGKTSLWPKYVFSLIPSDLYFHCDYRRLWSPSKIKAGSTTKDASQSCMPQKLGEAVPFSLA